MEVGNNPFPSEEVTGLAAFEDLEPVSSLSVVPEESDESQPHAARPATSEAAGAVARDRERLDKTLPLDLSVVHRSRVDDEEQELEPAPEDEVSPAEVAQLDGRLDDYAAEAAAEASADHLFDSSAQPLPALDRPVHRDLSWDDDEATRVITPLSAQAGQAADEPMEDATSPSLPMDWDDEEPPTTMRPGAMFEGSPLAAKSGWEDAEDNRTQIYDGALSEAETEEPFAPALPPAPSRRMQPSAMQTLTGGQPSPFPAPAEATPLHAPPLSPTASRVAAGDASVPERFLEAVKSGDKRSWLVLGGGAAGLVLLALIVRAAGGAPVVSSAVFSTKPLDARVSVDGKEVPGSSSPYSVAELAPGSHTLVVTKPGFEEYSGTFTLNRGESKNLPAIELTASAREVGFAIRSTPEGAAVWVDGQPTDQVTPARLTGVTPGIHRLQLKLEGHGDYELQMFVPEGTLLQLPAAELTPSPDAHPAKPARAARTHKGDDDDEDLASAAPRSSWRSRKAAAEADEDEVGSTRSARSARKSSSDSEPAYAAPAAAPSAPAAGKLGTLRLNTRPWSQVVVDGRMVGNTPQPNLQLSAGKHKLQLINQQLGVNKTVTITIKAGEITTQVLNLAD